ncbi:hypothetical protein [Marinobacter pelagius]|uniref:Uncharacterized protein n=1 Tax=Marinobacter pelagius TaxID=379482 RepID=A0A1I4Z5C2_9GAMM|nr:hypothetical protein [Marinobacter pelagius]SFN45169.1 hypothetical protein SAMN04487961_3136 [Marinobacter pelagius]
MSRVYSYCSTALSAALILILVIVSSPAWAEEPAGQLIDTQYEAVEARAIELVLNASGDVVGIRAKGCPGCPSSTILPSADLVIEAGERQIDGTEVKYLNGVPGVIHIYQPNGMAYRVSFPGVLSSGGGEQ